MIAIMNTPNIVFLSPTMASSSDRHQQRWQEAEQGSVGSPKQVLARTVKPYPWNMHLQTLGRALGGSWTGLTAVRTKSRLYTSHPPRAGPGRRVTCM